jgi:hypothetical protein
MILKILLGIDLLLAIASLLFIIMSTVSDLINTNNPQAYTKDMIAELKGHSGARWLCWMITSICWTIFIMCII